MLTNQHVVEELQEVALRRSKRERKSAIFYDYMVYLHEYFFDIGTSKDPLSLSQDIKVLILLKGWMPWKMKWNQCTRIKFGISSNCLKNTRKLIVNGSLRPRATLMAILNDLKLDLWPKFSLKKKALITKRPPPPYPRTHLKSFWHW